MDFSKILAGFKKYPKTEPLEYGTAGFRAKATLLQHVAFRVGILAGLRAKCTEKVIGLMITASHNPARDNGVKLIDPDGGMLELDWETIATKIVNSETHQIQDVVNDIIISNDIDITYEGTVILGWDTRPSSENLVSIACEGISSASSNPVKISLCTTPQLHYLVKCNNDPSYGVPNLEGYYDKMITSFEKLWQSAKSTNGNYIPEVNFDAANGVGAIVVNHLRDRVQDKLKINIYNAAINDHEKLNFQCGADYIKQAQKFPQGLPADVNTRCVSFDGDADRIMYYFLDETKTCHIVDGDKMAVLFALFLKEIITRAKINPSFGIVQTAYANGSSFRFIEEKLKIEAHCAKTGVKYLHHKASEFDIGVHFEANGHGTIFFSEKLKSEIANVSKTAGGDQLVALNQLVLFIDMINETVGDALSDMLAIENILHLKGWSVKDWSELYEPLPYNLTKVTIKDRNVITTTDAERVAVTPANLQPKIDETVSKYSLARSFVRPSGTEDLVRIYAEAATQAEADKLALEVSRLVYDLAGGVGDRP